MPDLDREVGEGEDIGSGGVGLVIERVEHGLDCWPQTLRSDRYQSGRVVSAVTLSRCSGQIRRDRVDQAGVGIGGDQMDSPSGGGQPDQRRTRSRLARFDWLRRHPEHFAVAVRVDPDREHHDSVDDPAAFTDLHRQRVSEDTGERARLAQRTVTTLSDMLIEVRTHAGHLRLGGA